MYIDSFLVDLYRTRLYLPLLVFFACWLFLPQLRVCEERISEKINSLKFGWVVFACATITFVFCILMIYEGKSWPGDFSQYFAQARAIATGTIPEWYEKNIFIINTSCDGIGSDVYPWLWPVILVPIYKMFGYFPYDLIKILIGLFVTGTIITLIFIYRRRMVLSQTIFLTAFSILTVNYLYYVNTCDSDLPALFFTVEAINFVDLFLREKNKRLSVVYSVLSGMFIFFAVQTKTMGMVLLLSLICYHILLLLTFLFQRMGKKFIFRVTFGTQNSWVIHFIPYVVYFVATGITNAILPKAGGTYYSYFTVAWYRIRYGAIEYYKELASFFGAACRPIITWIVFGCVAILLVLAIIGMFVAFRKEAYVIIYTLGLISMLLIYNYYRVGFIFTLYPMLILLAYYGVRFLVQLFHNQKDIKHFILGLGVTLLIMMFVEDIVICYQIRVNGFANNAIETEETQEVFQYIRENIDDDKVVYFDRPRVLYYFTDVNSYTWGDNPDKLEMADYVLISSGYWPKIENKISEEECDLVFSNNQYVLYKLE